MVKLLPWQIDPELTLIVGVMFTDTKLIANAVLVQPAELVPLTL
jgi:hypothetical protein